MSIDSFRGQVGHMASVAATSGFTGFEPETIMLSEAWDAASLAASLRESKIDLAALCLVAEWRGDRETDSEVALANRVIEALAAFPGTIINLVQFPGADREQLRDRQDHALYCMRDIAVRAEASGVQCSFHPNSPRGSVFRTPDDYERLLDLLDPLIGFTPDTGHIAEGGMNPIEVIARYRSRIRHVHVKDRYQTGGWAPTGLGDIDIIGVVEGLVANEYDGWIVFEDESPLAKADPDKAVRSAGAWISSNLQSNPSWSKESQH